MIKKIIIKFEEDDTLRFNDGVEDVFEYDGNPNLQACLKIRNLLEDFQAKRRWNAFCYHLNVDVMDL